MSKHSEPNAARPCTRENARKQSQLNGLSAQLSVKQMQAKAAGLTAANEKMETKLCPLRASKGDEVSPADLVKMEAGSSEWCLARHIIVIHHIIW
jgi:hypothetical protein